MDVKTLCLGLLSLDEACGYDLKKNFESLFKHFFAAGYGSIYPALANLAQAGLVECREVPQNGRPARKVYEITDSGRKHFQDILGRTNPTHKLRSDFLAMMYFADQLEGNRLQLLLDRRISEFYDAADHIERLTELRSTDTSAGARFVAGFGKAIAQAAASYIEENRHMLESQPKTLHTESRRKNSQAGHQPWGTSMSIGRTIAAKPWIPALAIIALVAAWMFSGTVRHDADDETGVVSGPVGQSSQDGSSELRMVQVQTQQASPVIRYINVYGRSAPARSVDVKAETNGRVVAIGIHRGQSAKKSAVIARLDLRDRRARLAQAEASVKEFETNYNAQLKLQNDGYVSETDIAEVIAKLESSKTELVRAQLDLKYVTIRAPYDGALATRDVEVGDFVRAGDIIATFIDNTKLIVSASLAEKDAQYVTVGDEATAILVTGQEVNGKIRFISPVADLATRTFAVELEVPNPDGTLPAGVTAEIRIDGGTVMAHKISPSLLSLETDGTIGVKTLDDQNRVVFHPVDIARSQTDGIWVTGLSETARIITVGQGYVLAGQTVEPDETPSTTTVAQGEINAIGD